MTKKFGLLPKFLFSKKKIIFSTLDKDGQTDRTNVVIKIIDENDNQPTVEYPLPNRDIVWVNPELRTGQLVAKIKATDLDGSDKNGEVVMSMQDASEIDFVNVDQFGEILVQRDLTENDFGRYSISVRIMDQGEPAKSILLRVRLPDRVFSTYKKTKIKKIC